MQIDLTPEDCLRIVVALSHESKSLKESGFGIVSKFNDDLEKRIVHTFLSSRNSFQNKKGRNKRKRTK